MKSDYESFPRVMRGIEVRVFNNDIEKAIRQLKKKATAEGLYRELNKRQYYQKPGAIRRRKKLEAKKRFRALMAKEHFKNR